MGKKNKKTQKGKRTQKSRKVSKKPNKQKNQKAAKQPRIIPTKRLGIVARIFKYISRIAAGWLIPVF